MPHEIYLIHHTFLKRMTTSDAGPDTVLFQSDLSSVEAAKREAELSVKREAVKETALRHVTWLSSEPPNPQRTANLHCGMRFVFVILFS